MKISINEVELRKGKLSLRSCDVRSVDQMKRKFVMFSVIDVFVFKGFKKNDEKKDLKKFLCDSSLMKHFVTSSNIHFQHFTGNSKDSFISSEWIGKKIIETEKRISIGLINWNSSLRMMSEIDSYRCKKDVVVDVVEDEEMLVVILIYSELIEFRSLVGINVADAVRHRFDRRVPSIHSEVSKLIRFEMLFH